jgi:hypothetical protein
MLNVENCLAFYAKSILWKIPIFIEKPPVKSSNCYETMKNDLILMKLGTNNDWTIEHNAQS